METLPDTFIGLMSGTSLDGIDLACVTFIHEAEAHSFQVLAAETIPYSDEWLKILQDVPHYSAAELIKTDRALGRYFGEVVNRFVTENELSPKAVASHGHTVFHNPSQGYTLQIGHGAALSAALGLPVITDFRSADVARGGQGAPLVPIGDRLLFGQYTVCLNLGGIANLSMQNSSGQTLAWDICAVNQVLNALVAPLELDYDAEGKIAESGHLDAVLLETLQDLPYYKMAPPKSLGREWVEAEVLPIFENSNASIPDKLNTYCHHTAYQIAMDMKTHSPNGGTWLATGGGAFNSFLMKLIRLHLGKNWHQVEADERLIAFKEAIIFAFLGYLRLHGRNNSLASVTGAKMDSCGGSVWLG